MNFIVKMKMSVIENILVHYWTYPTAYHPYEHPVWGLKNMLQYSWFVWFIKVTISCSSVTIFTWHGGLQFCKSKGGDGGLKFCKSKGGDSLVCMIYLDESYWFWGRSVFILLFFTKYLFHFVLPLFMIGFIIRWIERVSIWFNPISDYL